MVIFLKTFVYLIKDKKRTAAQFVAMLCCKPMILEKNRVTEVK